MNHRWQKNAITPACNQHGQVHAQDRKCYITILQTTHHRTLLSLPIASALNFLSIRRSFLCIRTRPEFIVQSAVIGVKFRLHKIALSVVPNRAIMQGLELVRRLYILSLELCLSISHTGESNFLPDALQYNFRQAFITKSLMVIISLHFYNQRRCIISIFIMTDKISDFSIICK